MLYLAILRLAEMSGCSVVDTANPLPHYSYGLALLSPLTTAVVSQLKMPIIYVFSFLYVETMVNAKCCSSCGQTHANYPCLLCIISV